MPRFVIRDEQGERTIDLDADPITIGRSQKCQVVVHDQKASREHCEIRRRDGGFLVLDLKSRNGTSVNGAALTERALAAGDRIEIGKASIVFEPVAASPAQPAPSEGGARVEGVPAAAPPAPVAPPAKPTAPPKDRCYLLFQEGERKDAWHVLDQLSVTLGRGKSNAVYFVDEKLSAHHAEIVLDVRKNRYYVIDHRSTNGTKVNGAKVPEAELANGAVIEIGAQKILFVDPRAGAPVRQVTPLATAPTAEADTDAGARGARGRGRRLAGAAAMLLFLGAAVAGVFFVWKKVRGPADDGAVTQLDPPQGSLIAHNHSFEAAGDAGKAELAGWKVIEQADGRVSRDAEAPPHGKRALLLHASEAASADGVTAVEYDETIDVERGAVYEAKAWVRTSRCRGLAGIRATWIADGKAVGTSFSQLVTGDEEWRVVKAAFLPPRRARQVRIACVGLGRFGDAGFDEVQLLRRAVAEADRPLVLRLAQWDLEADARGCFSLTPSGEAGKGEAIWDGGIALLGDVRRASQGCLLGDKGYPKRVGEGQEVRGRMFDLESGKPVPLSASVSVANDRATLSYVAEVPEAASSARVALVAALRGPVDALGIDGGAKTLDNGEASCVTRVDWNAGATPLVLLFKGPVTVRATERGGVTELACIAAEKSATLTVTLESKASIAAGEVGALLDRADRAYVEGRGAEALALLQEAIDRFPDDEATVATARPRATELAAEAEGDLAEVEEAALGAMDISRAKSLLAALSRRWSGTEWEERAKAAVAEAEKEIAGSATDAAARAEAEKLASLAEKAIAEEKWLMAKVYGKNLIEKFPGTPWETRGKDLIARSDAGQAAAAAREAWIQETLTKARNLAANGQKDAARAAYEEILAKHPKHPLAAQAAKELAALQ